MPLRQIRNLKIFSKNIWIEMDGQLFNIATNRAEKLAFHLGGKPPGKIKD